MADSRGGVWRRDKKGDLEQIKVPAKPQKYGAHDRHPATVKAGAKSDGKSSHSAKASNDKQGGGSNADS